MSTIRTENSDSKLTVPDSWNRQKRDWRNSINYGKKSQPVNSSWMDWRNIQLFGTKNIIFWQAGFALP